MKKYSIRTFPREDLERMFESKCSVYTQEEIRAELNRRDEFAKLFSSQPQKYPELNPSFN